MKTRQEMILDFMVALSANSEVHKEWQNNFELLGSYSTHVKAIAEEMANTYLSEVL